MGKIKKKDLKRKKDFLYSLDNIPTRDLVKLLPNLSDENLSFLTNCLGGVIRCDCPHLKLNKKEQLLAKSAWAPYQKSLKKWECQGNEPEIVYRIKKQTGEGLVLSALLSAAIPLVTNLVKKVLGNKS